MIVLLILALLKDLDASVCTKTILDASSANVKVRSTSMNFQLKSPPVDMTASSDRPCQLHGCTVELLRCSGSRLKKTEDGCTLCECEHEGDPHFKDKMISKIFLRSHYNYKTQSSSIFKEFNLYQSSNCSCSR